MKSKGTGFKPKFSFSGIFKSKESKSSKKVKAKKPNGSRYPKVKLTALFVILLAFGATTYFVGFEEVEEVKTKLETKEVFVNEPLIYESRDSSSSGLSPTGSFIVRHNIIIENEDEVDGDFIVTSKVKRGSDESEIGSAAKITSGGSYTFEILHNRAWGDDYDSYYEVEVSNKTVSKLENDTIEYTVVKKVWKWPWW